MGTATAEWVVEAEISGKSFVVRPATGGPVLGVISHPTPTVWWARGRNDYHQDRTKHRTKHEAAAAIWAREHGRPRVLREADPAARRAGRR